MPAMQVPRQSPVSEVARLMLQLHALSLQGHGNSPAAAVACVAMEEPWEQLTEREQERMRGLSMDLYAIEDGGVPQVAMAVAERLRWVEQSQEAFTALQRGDYDFALQFLRRPTPEDRPQYMLAFLQARCWERLGEFDVALVFMRESQRHNPAQAVFVMGLLERGGHTAEAADFARRLIDDSGSSPFVLWQAAGVLLETLRRMPDAEAQPTLEALVTVLRRALQAERPLPRNRREFPDTEPSITSTLGACLELLGRTQEALAIYSDGLANYPDDWNLLTMRGIARYASARPLALQDLKQAADNGALSAWPSYLLAHAALEQGNYFDCWQMCLRALERPADREIHSQLHEWLGICRLMLKQSSAVVLESFDQAVNMLPGSERILRNRAIAERHLIGNAVSPSAWDKTPAGVPRNGRHTLAASIRTQREVFVVERDNRVADLLSTIPA